MQRERYERWYGKNYQQGLSIVEIASRVKNYANTKIEEGKLPKGIKFSIGSEKYSMGKSLRMHVTKYPKEMLFYDPKSCNFGEYAKKDITNFYCRELHPDIASEIKDIETYAQSYNYDGSDSMIDYYDVNFGGARINSQDIDYDERTKIIQCFSDGQYSKELCSPLITLHNNSKEILMQPQKKSNIKQKSPTVQKMELSKKESPISSSKLELALQNVIKEVGFTSTVGTGKCICYGGAKKCGDLPALWSDDAYKVLQKNSFNVKNAKDLIDLDIKSNLKEFTQLQLRGGFVLCDPNMK